MQTFLTTQYPSAIPTATVMLVSSSLSCRVCKIGAGTLHLLKTVSTLHPAVTHELSGVTTRLHVPQSTHTHYELFSTPDHGLLKLEPNRSLGNKHMLCMLDLIFYFKLKKKKLHIKAVLVYTDGLCNEEVGQAGFSQLE